MKKAFTLIEVIIVTVLLATMAVIGTISISNYQRDTALGTTAASLVSQLRYAQGRAISGEGTTTWGIHFDTTEQFYAIYQGLNWGAATDIVKTYLMHGVLLYNPTLNGAGTDVLFSRLTGITSQYGTGAGSAAICITNTSAPTTCKKTITITANGKISWQ
ncbi:MAG: prepilin-type N-terminal cleavage/methylation domain-containing protein [Candidatus Gracilibacteria bacterium]